MLLTSEVNQATIGEEKRDRYRVQRQKKLPQRANRKSLIPFLKEAENYDANSSL